MHHQALFLCSTLSISLIGACGGSAEPEFNKPVTGALVGAMIESDGEDFPAHPMADAAGTIAPAPSADPLAQRAVSGSNKNQYALFIEQSQADEGGWLPVEVHVCMGFFPTAEVAQKAKEALDQMPPSSWPWEDKVFVQKIDSSNAKRYARAVVDFGDRSWRIKKNHTGSNLSDKGRRFPPFWIAESN